MGRVTATITVTNHIDSGGIAIGRQYKAIVPSISVNVSSPTSALSAIASITACDGIVAIATEDIISPNTTMETVIPAAQIN